jgi:RHS repeat-associated protein
LTAPKRSSSIGYDAWGNPATAPTPLIGGPTLGYRGELTTTNLTHLRARDYDPTTAAFTTTDPLDGIDGTPTIANPYHYANNDPINQTDPTGLRPTDAGFSWHTCSDLSPLTLPGEALWQTTATSCFFLPSGINPNSPCFTNSWQQNTADLTYGVMRGLTFGQQDRFVEESRACHEGIEVLVGELIGATVSTAAIGEVIGAAFRGANSVWKLGNFARGFAVEERLFRASELLATNFPRIDRFVDGVATSIKSVDLTAASYQRGSRLRTVLQTYVDDVAGFNGARGFTRAGAQLEIRAAQITSRELLVAIEPGVATLEQRLALREIAQYGSQRGVNVVVRTVR